MIEKITDTLWGIKGDTHISKWARDSKGFTVSGDAALSAALKFIKPGDLVLDVGCNIGRHSWHYGKAVGPDGLVIGFDPNPEAIECCKFNCIGKNFEFLNYGLANTNGQAAFVESPNTGASFLYPNVVDQSPYKVIQVRRLDDLHIYSEKTINLIKMDVEGYEVAALRGAEEKIHEAMPVMVIEVNHGALMRAGSSPKELISLVQSYGYRCWPIPVHAKFTDEQLDILCMPDRRP